MCWPEKLREQWGVLANKYEESGMGWLDAEVRACDEIRKRLVALKNKNPNMDWKAAGFGRPPEFPPNPYEEYGFPFPEEMELHGHIRITFNPDGSVCASYLYGGEAYDRAREEWEVYSKGEAPREVKGTIRLPSGGVPSASYGHEHAIQEGKSRKGRKKKHDANNSTFSFEKESA